MQFSLTHSLRTHIEQSTGVKTVWLFDGIKLPQERPLITIEQMTNTNEVISKQRSVETVYRYQIGLSATSIRERSLIQEEIRDVLTDDKITLLDALNPGETLGYFYAVVTGETPITPDDVSDKSEYHRVYFDVEVRYTKTKI